MLSDYLMNMVGTQGDDELYFQVSQRGKDGDQRE